HSLTWAISVIWAVIWVISLLCIAWVISATRVISLIWAVIWVISLLCIAWASSATRVISPTWVASVTFALRVIGRIAIGRGAIPGTVTFGPLPVGITGHVGSTALGDG